MNKSHTIFIIVAYVIINTGGCLRPADNDTKKNDDVLKDSLLWKDLHSSSRECLHRGTVYLSRNREKMSQGTPVLATDKIVYASDGESIEVLKERSKSLQSWLKEQKSKDIVRLIDDYKEYLESHSPYYLD